MRFLTRILFSLPHNGGAHSAPARERRGASGPRKRPSRGVGRSPTLVRSEDLEVKSSLQAAFLVSYALVSMAARLAEGDRLDRYAVPYENSVLVAA